MYLTDFTLPFLDLTEENQFQFLQVVVDSRFLTINHRYEGSPLQGPSGAWRGSSMFSRMLPVIDPPRGAPLGAAAFIVNN